MSCLHRRFEVPHRKEVRLRRDQCFFTNFCTCLEKRGFDNFVESKRYFEYILQIAWKLGKGFSYLDNSRYRKNFALRALQTPTHNCIAELFRLNVPFDYEKCVSMVFSPEGRNILGVFFRPKGEKAFFKDIFKSKKITLE